jgi:hypothetical protein
LVRTQPGVRSRELVGAVGGAAELLLRFFSSRDRICAPALSPQRARHREAQGASIDWWRFDLLENRQGALEVTGSKSGASLLGIAFGGGCEVTPSHAGILVEI